MFFLVYEVTPRPTHPEGNDLGGAFVSCWVDRPSLKEAHRVAQQYIAKAGWIVGEYDEAYPVEESTYPIGSSGRPRFEQALVDGEVFVIHTFPVVDHE